MPWTLWTGTVTALSLAIVLDQFDFFARDQSKTLIVFVCLGLTLYHAFFGQCRLNRPGWPMVLWLLYMSFALPGALYGKFRPGSPKTLFIAVVMGLLVVSAQFIPPRMARIDPAAALKVMRRIGLTFLIVVFCAHFFVSLKNLPTIRTHERGFLLPLAFFVAALERRPLTLLFSGALMAGLFVMDVRTTVLLIYVATIASITYYYLPGKVKFIAAAAAVLTLAALSPNIYTLIKSANASFKVSARRNDNSKFREDLMELGLNKFKKSPVFGTFFVTGGAYDLGYNPMTEVTKVTTSSILPLHNDFLEILASGGLVGFSLFMGAYVGFMATAFLNYGRCKRRGFDDHARYNFVLCVTLANSAICLVANPVLNWPANGFCFYALLALVAIEDRFLRANRVA